ncbi:hypothetical protein AK88_01694 [Plasmodium fragile]|uniref:J domain-containing protein n=1 Tax=Plasmodium fragile TaxID=5857 RepID=A0A0D9QNK4_PLAFR|nr:uncharacterized protein AK88_01694 [Plasmodium fragile]KJP88614.1 hypothetical protein AK88_01694 [Plasmodium fragile]
MLNDIIFQVIIASFGVTIVNSDKIKFLQKFRYAIYVLILSFLLYKGIPWKRDNFYTYLNITPNATKQEIQTAYRQAAKIYHPDKNPDESADSSFIKLKQAYDILTDDMRRSNYNRFGDYKNGEVDDNTATLLICLSLVQNTMFFIIGYFLSYAIYVLILSFLLYKGIPWKRDNFYTYLNITPNATKQEIQTAYRQAAKIYHPDKNPDESADSSFIKLKQAYDILTDDMRRSNYNRFGDYKNGYLLPYEKIKLLRMLFPIVFFISICSSAYAYTDRNATLIYLMRSILATNRIVFERSNDVVDSTNYLKKNGEQLVYKLQEMRKAVEDGKYAQAKIKDKEQKDETECLEDGKKDPKDQHNADDKLRDNVKEFALTLDSHQMGLLEKCFEMMKNKNSKDKKNQKKSWFEFFSMQMIFGIIFVYIWLTSK